MAGWHHWLDGHESEWTPGVVDGQGGLACCSSSGRKESDMTEQLNWTELNTIKTGIGFKRILYVVINFVITTLSIMLTNAIRMNCISFVVLFALNFVYLVGFLKLPEGYKYKGVITLFRFLHNLRKKTQECVRILFHLITKVQYSLSVVYDSLRPHRLQNARLPGPSPTPRAYSNSCPLSRWCYPIISSSVIPFSWLQSFPASGSFQMSQLFSSGGQRIGVSASTSVLPMNTQDQSPLGWTGWISLQSRDCQESSPTPQFKSINSSQLSLLMGQLSHPYMTTGKTKALTIWTFVDKVITMLFKTLSLS